MYLLQTRSVAKSEQALRAQDELSCASNVGDEDNAAALARDLQAA
jgi:hypothetical protein